MNSQPDAIQSPPDQSLPDIDTDPQAISDTDIAIIGMAGRFPDAESVDAFWQNLRDGRESVRTFSDDALKAAGVPSFVLQEPGYVKAGVVLDGIEEFDAAFFGFSPREAEMIDPQHRLFLEQAWTVLEQGGYTADQYEGAIAVYAGVGVNTYLLSCLYPHMQQAGGAVGYQAIIRNDKDFLPTLVSYKLNLKGPSVSVQTACSTSLVAVHMACQSLLNGECDMALAGAASLRVAQNQGYLYEPGMILSPDGHCRAFDAQAQGTVGGSGVATVLLKRLGDAIDDGDTIQAVIKGSAVNNDGSDKVGYTAPSVSGQAAVIAEAQAIAGVDPTTISYIEAHGTGTVLGDPIELAALTQSFQKGGVDDETSEDPDSAASFPTQFCALGSVKTNIGHLDTAAGMAGLIKTAMALRHKQLPPSLHFKSPNPAISFSESPFYVNTELKDWHSHGEPRRAGVSAFGIGGTNAHVVMEEAPGIPASLEASSAPSRTAQVIGLSAKTPTALTTLAANLAAHLKATPNLNTTANFADVAFTLNRGRKGLDHRRALVASTATDAIAILDSWAAAEIAATRCKESASVCFMFSGQGSQYVNMGRDLYHQEPVFREVIDQCAAILQPLLGEDIRGVLYPAEFSTTPAADSQNSHPSRLVSKLDQTALTQPALFMVEYALAQLWIAWGIQPVAMVGHSIGEYVAACLAGVFSLEDGLRLVAMRGQLMQSLPAGSMLAIALPPSEVQDLLKSYPALSLATVNGPSCVASGPSDRIEALQQGLARQSKADTSTPSCRLLRTSHAFHSAMMDAILPAFTQQVQSVTLNPPTLPYLSNVSGTWISEAQATDPHYWAAHLRQAVQFAPAVTQLLQDANAILLEVGPGRTLTQFAKQHPDLKPSHQCLTSLRHPKETRCDVAFVLQTLGSLWSAGLDVDWRTFYQAEQRRRLPLPTYPFERQRYWIEADASSGGLDLQQFRPVSRQPNVDDWLYVPSWKRSQLPDALTAELTIRANPLTWLIFLDGCGVGDRLVERLRGLGQSVWTVVPGDRWQVKGNQARDQMGDRALTINPGNPADFDQMIEYLQQRNQRPTKIIHGWTLTAATQPDFSLASVHQTQRLGLHTLLSLAQSLGRQPHFPNTDLIAITNGIHEVTGDEPTLPTQSTLLAPIKVLPLEYPHLKCRSLDIVLPAGDRTYPNQAVDLLLAECLSASPDADIAYRGRTRWLPTYIPAQVSKSDKPSETDKALTAPPPVPRLRTQGVYLITGGTGGVGLSLAQYLASTVQAQLVLVKRSEFLPKDQWQTWLAAHDDDEPTAKTIRSLQAVEAAGGKVKVVSGDVACVEDMTRVVAAAEAEFGPINGVIHCAGLADKGGIVQARSRADSDRILAAKVQGTLVLHQVLSHRPLDIFVLSSSLSATLYKTLFGQVAYCAANDFLDAFAIHQSARRDAHRNTFTLSIDWTEWLEVGMAVAAKSAAHDKESSRANAMADQLPIGDLILGIQPTEGQAAFDRLLRQSAPRVVVSTQDLDALLHQQAAFDPHEFLQQFLLRQAPETNATQYPRPPLSVAYVAPHSPLAFFLSQLWQDFLGIQPVGMNDNFFELGGDSLSSLGLTTQLQQKLGVELSSNVLLDNATLATLTTYLEDTYAEELAVFKDQTFEAEAAPPEPEPPAITAAIAPTNGSSLSLLRMRQGNRDVYSPLFFVHPIGGGVACYTTLLRSLDPQRPFYGLRAVGLDDGQKPHTNIQAMARDYIAAIKTVQPSGPYTLGGWSMGGVVAYEMAQQLNAQGTTQQTTQQTTAVIMLDSPAPIQKEGAEPSLSQLLVFARSLEIPDAQTQPLALSERFRALALADQLEEIRRRAVAVKVLPESFGRSHMRALYNVFQSNDTALKQYVATPDITGTPMFFIRAQEASSITGDRDTLGWQQLVGHRLRVAQARGDHYSMVKNPQAQALGELIETYLQSVQQPSMLPLLR